MQRLATLILAAVLLLPQAGCGIMAPKVAMITHQQAAELDFGPYPANYQEIVKDYLKKILKDPDSAKVEFLDKPEKATSDGLSDSSGSSLSVPRYGWGNVVRINAKNSYGAYTGYKNREYLIWNGQVIYLTGVPLLAPKGQPMPAGGPKLRDGAPVGGLRYF